jgi:hypothetical protein
MKEREGLERCDGRLCGYGPENQKDGDEEDM